MVPNSLKKSGLRLGIKEAVTVTGINEETTIPMTNILEQNGNGLEVLSDGTIKALRDINVFVNVLITLTNVATSNNQLTRISIFKNNVIIASDQHAYSSSFNVSTYLKLKKNDIVKISILDFARDNTKTGSASNTNKMDIFEV